MHPAQPPIHWGGAVMWRGTTWAKPIRTGSSFVGLGTHRYRMVFYPISDPDPLTGLAMINWIAEVTMDNAEGWKQRGWFRQVGIDDFIHHFDGWVWDWRFDVPALLRGAETAFENPMIDRDPMSKWQDGPVALLGDAAHGTYPDRVERRQPSDRRRARARGRNGRIRRHAGGARRLQCKALRAISELILRNRGARPFGLLNTVDERCGGTFDNIDDVIPAKERAEFMAGYKAVAGFATEKLNKSLPTIAPRPCASRARELTRPSRTC
jgi:hypothetical protein